MWGYTCSLVLWICAVSHSALVLFQKRVSQGNLSHVQQSICSGDKFPTLLRALLLSAAFLWLALSLLQFQSHATMHPENCACSWMWNSINSVSVSGTWIQNAISEFYSWQNFLWALLPQTKEHVFRSFAHSSHGSPIQSFTLNNPAWYLRVHPNRKNPFWNRHSQL